MASGSTGVGVGVTEAAGVAFAAVAELAAAAPEAPCFFAGVGVAPADKFHPTEPTSKSVQAKAALDFMRQI